MQINSIVNENLKKTVLANSKVDTGRFLAILECHFKVMLKFG